MHTPRGVRGPVGTWFGMSQNLWAAWQTRSVPGLQDYACNSFFQHWMRNFLPFFVGNLILRLALFPSQPPGLCVLSVIHKRRALSQIENAAQAVPLEQCHINNRGRKNKMSEKNGKKGDFISPLWRIGTGIHFCLETGSFGFATFGFTARPWQLQTQSTEAFAALQLCKDVHTM